MSSKPYGKPVNPGAKYGQNAARDKQIGILLFVLDGLILTSAIFLFAGKQSCPDGIDNNYSADYSFNISETGNVNLQQYDHDSPAFNRFQPSSYGSSSYESSPFASSFGSSSYGSSYNSNYGGTSPSSWAPYGSSSTNTGSGYNWPSYSPTVWNSGSTSGSTHDTGSSSYDSLSSFGYSPGPNYGFGTSSSTVTSGSDSLYGSSYGESSFTSWTGSSPSDLGSTYGSNYGSGFPSSSSGSSAGSGSTYGWNYGFGSPSSSSGSSDDSGSTWNYGFGSPSSSSGSSDGSGSTYEWNYGFGSSSSPSGSSDGSSSTYEWNYGFGSPSSPSGSSDGSGSTYEWNYGSGSPSSSVSSGSSSTSSGSSAGSGSTFGWNYGSGSSAGSSVGSSSGAGSSSGESIDTGSSSSISETTSDADSSNTQNLTGWEALIASGYGTTWTFGTGVGTVTSLADKGITVGIGTASSSASSNGSSGGPHLAAGETISYWVYKPYKPKPKPTSPSSGSTIDQGATSGVSSSFSVAPSPSGTGSTNQIAGINAGANGFGSTTGFGSTSGGFGDTSGGSLPIGGGSTAISQGEYPFKDLVDIIPEDTIVNTDFKCGIPKVKPNLKTGRIVGGTEAVKHSWPWTVNVMARDAIFSGEEFFNSVCGATIVSPKHVISALHCFASNSGPGVKEKVKVDVNRYWRLFIGKHDQMHVKGEQYEIAKLRWHHKGVTFPYVIYDLVILTTKKEIKFSDKVQPACLPKYQAERKHGSWCWAVGWGFTQGTGSDNELKQVRLKIGNPEACEKNLGYSKELLKKEIAVCAGTEKGQDTCQGDSGGPLTCEDNGKVTLYGATSWGGDCGSGNYAVYASVSFALEWICCFMANIPGCRGVSCNPKPE
ncbi:uncharacterized protein LOC120346822 [Styela clava]